MKPEITSLIYDFLGGITVQSFTLSMATYCSCLDLRPFLVPALLLLLGGRLVLAAVAGLYAWQGRSRIFGRFGLDLV